MQTLPNGVEVPTNSDAYNLTDDLAASFMDANLVVPVASAAARDTYKAARPGLVSIVCRTDLAGLPLEIWDGTTWHRYSRSYAKAAGVAVIGGVGGGGSAGPFFQAFPAGRFSVAPVVIVNTDQTRLVAVAADVSTSGFNLYMTNLSAGSSSTGQLRWIAEQMTSTAATG